MVEFYISLIFLFLLCSMIFSSAEATIFSVSRVELASLRLYGLSQKFTTLLGKPEELLVVLIAGNEIVDYFISFLGAKLFYFWFLEKGKYLALFVCGIISFWIGDFLPKVLGFKLRVKLFTKLIYPVYVFYYLFFPIRQIYKTFSAFLDKVIPSSKVSFPTVSPVEQIILYILDKAYSQKKITEKEKTFIRGLFLSEKITVSAIMTPRSEIVAFEDQIITVSFLEKLKYLPYNKFPVYKENLDNLIGIFYVKDLFKDLPLEVVDKKKLSDYVRPVVYIPESFTVRDLLFEFQEKNIKIAMVVDEYGTIKGLVTLEDVLEELFGEIYEQREAKIELIQKIGENKWLFHGKLLMEVVKEVLNLEIEKELEDIKTLNGFILALFKEVPEEGKSVIYKNFKFTVKKLKGRKILWVEVEKNF